MILSGEKGSGVWNVEFLSEQDMIRINVTLSVGAGVRTEVAALLSEMAELSRGERGCIGYEILENCRLEDTMMIIETWENEVVLAEMELDSCWVTLTDSEAVKKAAGLTSEKNVAAIIAFGYGNSLGDRTRLDIKSPSDVHVITREGHLAPKICVEDLVYLEKWGQKSDWEEDVIDDSMGKAFYGASVAPSFLNRQPFRFIYDYNRMMLAVKEDELTGEHDGKLNQGIVMFHFAAVLSQWRPTDIRRVMEKPDRDYGVPDEYEIVAYCAV